MYAILVRDKQGRKKAEMRERGRRKGGICTEIIVRFHAQDSWPLQSVLGRVSFVLLFFFLFLLLTLRSNVLLFLFLLFSLSRFFLLLFF